MPREHHRDALGGKSTYFIVFLGIRGPKSLCLIVLLGLRDAKSLYFIVLFGLRGPKSSYLIMLLRESVEFYRQKLVFCTSKIDSEPNPCVIVARNAVHMFIYIARGARKCRVLSRKVSFLYFKNRLGTPSVRHCRTKRCLYVYIHCSDKHHPPN